MALQRVPGVLQRVSKVLGSVPWGLKGFQMRFRSFRSVPGEVKSGVFQSYSKKFKRASRSHDRGVPGCLRGFRGNSEGFRSVSQLF